VLKVRALVTRSLLDLSLPGKPIFAWAWKMAQDSETPKSVDKGKGKAVDGETSKGKEVEKDKDGKPLVNGKKEEPVIGGMIRGLCCL
jgi:hypothetical protein